MTRLREAPPPPATNPPRPRGHDPSRLVEEDWQRVLPASPLAIDATDQMAVDAGVLEAFLALMSEEHGRDAFDVLRAVLSMAGSLKRTNAPRYSIIGQKIRFDIENGVVTFIGRKSDRRTYGDLATQETPHGK